MSAAGRADLPFDAPLDALDLRATELLDGLRRGRESAVHAFRWHHPDLDGYPLAEVAARADGFGPTDARQVVASLRGFASWDSMAAFAAASAGPGPVRRFEQGVEAVVAGDLATLRNLFAADPDLIRARSRRRHRATLLHYVAANGVEDFRQRTPANVVEVAALLLDAGAEVDAVAEAYGGPCTTLHLLVSSGHPAEAGVQADLAALLVRRGARVDHGGTSAVDVALAFGYDDTARRLVAEGAPVDRLSTAAGLGWRERVRAELPSASARERHRALALAAFHGHAAVVGALLDAGEDPNRFNPPDLHRHSTPLHQAALAGHTAVVERLLAAGARTDLRDGLFGGTAADWAAHAGQSRLAARLAPEGDEHDAR